MAATSTQATQAKGMLAKSHEMRGRLPACCVPRPRRDAGNGHGRRRWLTAAALTLLAGAPLANGAAEAPITSDMHPRQLHYYVPMKELTQVVGQAVYEHSSKLHHALGFTTGDNAAGYDLTGVVSHLTDVGANAVPRVSIYSAVKNNSGIVVPAGDETRLQDYLPGSSLYTLANPASVTDGENTFTAPPGATLESNTYYVIVWENSAPGTDAASQYSLYTNGGSGYSVLPLPDEILYLSSSCGKNGWAIWHRYHRTPAPTTPGSPGSWVYHATSSAMGAAVLASPTGGMAAANSVATGGPNMRVHGGNPPTVGALLEGVFGVEGFHPRTLFEGNGSSKSSPPRWEWLQVDGGIETDITDRRPLYVINDPVSGLRVRNFPLANARGTLRLTADDLGKQIKVRVTYLDDDCFEEVVTSEASATVTAGPFSLGGLSDATAAENTAFTSAVPTLTGSPTGTVTWFLEGVDYDFFSVSQTDGVVSLAGRNFEQPGDTNRDNVYAVTLVATDADHYAATASFTVTVTDVVEMSTVTIGGLSSATTAENAAWTSPTPTVTGVPGAIGAVTWSKSGADAALFSQAPDGGLTLGAQDYESPADADGDNVYAVTVVATDADDNTGGQSIEVTVTDVIETSTVTIGGLSDATTSENAAWTSPVPTAAGAIGAVTWTKSGADAALFTLASDGRLTLGAQDYETPADADAEGVYEVTLRAVDADANEATYSLEVTITDVVETATVTIGGLSNATTPENAAWTSPTPTVTGAIGALTWTKYGADAALFTQASDGWLTLGAQDYESPADADGDNVYAATVVATDADENTDGQSIEVTVTDVIETSTVTIGGLSNATTPENAAWTSPAPTASGAIGAVTWSKSGADAGMFTLGSDGRLTLPAQDYEAPTDVNLDNDYQVTVRAEDADANAAQVSITISVTDSTETSTVTIGGLSNASTPENTAWTSPIPTAAGAIGAVTWTKSGADAALFTQASDGQLTLGAQDYETPADADGDNGYEVTLRARDGEGNEGAHSIEVAVTDVNGAEEAPITSNMHPRQLHYHVPIKELKNVVGQAVYEHSGKRHHALGFTTGDNAAGYDLTGVVSHLTDVGANAVPRVSIYSAVKNNSGAVVPAGDETRLQDYLPGSSLYTLATPASVTDGENTFTAPPGATLESNTYYVIVWENSAPGTDAASQYSLHTDGGSGVSVLTLPGEILYLSSSCGKNGWAIWHRYHRTPAPTTSGSPGSWVYHATSALMGAAVLASPTGGMAAANSVATGGPNMGVHGGNPPTVGALLKGSLGAEGSHPRTLFEGNGSSESRPPRWEWLQVDGGIETDITDRRPLYVIYDPVSGLRVRNFPIANAKGTLRLTADDLGKQIKVRVTYLDDDCFEEVVTSEASATVTAGPFSLGGLSDATVAENTAFTSAVPTLTGSPTGAVTWSLEGVDYDFFSVSQTDGVVSMVGRNFEQPVDTNRDNVYALTLVATDSDHYAATAPFTVTLTDVVETATVTVGGLSNATTTPENAAWTSPLPTATGGIGALAWSKSGADAALFTQASDGGLTLGAQDYEMPADADGDNVYEATVVATDADDNTGGQSIEVTVTDVIETSTVTIGGLSDASTAENAPWTSLVPTVAGAIGEVTWSKSGPDAGLFTQASDGRLTLGAQDYEMPADANGDNVYEATVVATDADDNAGGQSIEVTVTDVVEMSTVTIVGLSNATTPENAAWTSPSPTATGGIGAVTWSKSGADAALFTLASNGRLTLGAQDYETPADADGDNVYEATVVATDTDQNTDGQSIEVTVTDVIETSTVTIGGLSNATTPENATWTSPIPTAAGAIGAVTWTKSGADAGLFTLASDGRLTLLAQDYEAPTDVNLDNDYQVTVRAQDADANAAQVSITISVTDSTETSTVTVDGLSDASTAENAAWTSPVPTAVGAIGAVTWSKSGPDAGLFTQASDGRLTLGAQDYETHADANADNVYEVTPTATDGDGNVGARSIGVVVTDVVETSTVTVGGLSNATTPENSTWTSPAPTASGVIGAVTWGKSGADAALFTQASDGRLTLGAQDYEAPADANADNVYAVTVTATDADDNVGAHSLEVQVTNVFDDTPLVRFGASSYTAKEGGADARVRVELSEAVGSPVTIPLIPTNRGGATNADYSGVPPNVTFGAFETSKTFTVTATDDSVDDDGESVRIGFGTLPSTVEPGSRTKTTVHLQDNDGLSVSFGKTFYKTREGGEPATVKVQLTKAPASSLTIPLTTEHRNWATAADYSGVPPSVTFGPSERVRTFTVTVERDNDIEDAEEVRIGFGTLPPGVVAGSPAWTSVALEDDLSVAFGAASYTAAEGGAGVTVTVRLTKSWGAPFTLPLTVQWHGGASTSDYTGIPGSVMFRGEETTQTFTVTAVDDAVNDDGESVEIGFGWPRPQPVWTGVPSTATVELVDNDNAQQEGALRLTQGAGVNGGSSGRLQVYHDGRWGLVCDTNFDELDARVACRQLGFADGEEGYADAGSGGLPFWLKGLACDGTESRLANCPHRGLKEHSCGSFDIVGLECSRTPLSMTDARVRGTLLTLSYDAALDGGSAPSGRDFVVIAGPPGGASAVPVTSVAVGGEAVVLTLERPVLPDETVYVSYLVAPMHPVQDTSGSRAAPLADLAVRNETRIAAPRRLEAAAAAESPGAATALPVSGPAPPREPLDLSPWLADGGASAPLGRLDLSSRTISDIGALAGLTALRVLRLEDNGVVDLGPLSALTGLRVLDLSSNAIADVGPLSALTELERLNLSGNRIADVSALSGLTGLKVLLLDGNRIADVLPLWSLQGLLHLGLAGNRVADIGLLAELASLQRLDLTGNRVSDVSPLGDLSRLVWLRLAGNPVAQMSPLGRLTLLRWLWLDAGVVGREALEAPGRAHGTPLRIEGVPARQRNGEQ